MMYASGASSRVDFMTMGMSTCKEELYLISPRLSLHFVCSKGGPKEQPMNFRDDKGLPFDLEELYEKTTIAFVADFEERGCRCVQGIVRKLLLNKIPKDWRCWNIQCPLWMVVRKELTKNCFVLLERLDKQVLDEYLRKEDSDFEGIAKEPRKRRKRRPRLAKRPSKTAVESARKDCFERRKKIRAQPLHYAEDEDGFSSANPTENISEKTTADNLSAPFLNPKPEVGVNHNGTLIGSKKIIRTRKKGLISESFLKDSSDKTADAVMQPKSHVRPSEEFLQKAIQNFPEQMDEMANNDRDDFDLGLVKREIEVVEELRESGSFKKELKWDGEDERPDFAPVDIQGFEYEENESRDEDEDDRATIVFDRSFNDGATHFEEVFEKAEEKIQNVTKNFKKKKIMNRKKKTLVKFKRKKSIIGRNLAKVRKLKKKNSEVSNSRLLSAEKESERESNMGEVCGLVKRLHELYRIILQLQKKLPMDAEQADYFMRTIQAQQESFYREIKKSEKTIMRGYDKMLSSFGNANTVSMEIGKRTCLSKEDIADVISKCKMETSAGNLQKVDLPQSIQIEKATKEDPGNTFNHPGKSLAPGSGSEDGAVDPAVTLRSQSVQSSGHHRPPKSLQRSDKEPNVAKTVETRENHPAEHFLQGSSNSLRVSRPLQNRNNNQVQWFDVSKPRAHLSPRENFPCRTHVPHRDPRFIQFPQQDPCHVPGNKLVMRPFLLRPVHSHLSNARVQYGRVGSPIQGGGTSGINYRPINNNNVKFFQMSDGFVPSAPFMAEPAPRGRIQSLMDVNPFPFGYPQSRLPPHNIPQAPNSCSVPLGVQLPSGPHFDRPKHNNAPAQTSRIQNNFSHSTNSFNNFQRPNSFPSSKSSEFNVPGASNQTFPKEGQGYSRNLLMSFSGFVQSSIPTQTYPVTEPPADLEQTRQQTYSLSTEPASKSVALESHVLDPTVPQKLTMRNCRLEAGPVLKLKNEDVLSKGGEKPCQGQESTSDAGGAETLNQKELNSRVYVCAQHGCKNPGVRICKGCQSIIYCSETCQLKHWTLKHKTECHQLKELRG